MAQPVSADDLLVLLVVARLGRYSVAADVLGMNHTTVSRRIAALERALGSRVLLDTPSGWELTETGRTVLAAAEQVEAALESLGEQSSRGLTGTVRLATPDGFGTHVAVPALVQLGETHPGLQTELITATQRLRHNRTGVDIDVVVGEPQVQRARAVHLLDYRLRLYATAEYLARAGTPRTLDDLRAHCLIYYIEQTLQVDELDVAVAALPTFARAMRSTSVFVHVRATLAGGGIGILPDFMAVGEPALVPVLPDDYAHPATYWAVIRPESLRNPAVAAAMHALHTAAAQVRGSCSSGRQG